MDPTWNKLGIFPAPDQAERDFFRKVQVLQNLSISNDIQMRLDDFDIDASWVPIAIDNRGLSLWEGAVLWQEQIDPYFTLPKIQVSKRLYRLCSCNERIAHEMVHASRVDFTEERFEEILAYTTSAKAWRRYWGPLFQNPFEVGVFIGSICLTVVLQMLFLIGGWLSELLLFPWISMGLIFLGWIRLRKKHQVFNKCLSKISSVIQDPHKGKAVLLRMSDQEIGSFATMSSQEIIAFMHAAKERSFRWYMIVSYYLEKRI